jgi:membrane protease YdiL (CAAX protease family)
MYLLLATAGVVWIGWRLHGVVPLALFLPLRRDFWLDPLLGVAAAGLLLGAWSLLRRVSRLARALEETIRVRIGPLPAHEAYGLALLSGVAEEVFFRGALQPAWGYAAATVLFGVLHSGRERALLVWTAGALIAGALLGALMLWRGNLLAPVLCHVLVNAVQLRRLVVTPAAPR